MKFEFSAGGVVFKKTAGKVEMLVCQHSQHHGWVFPKGLIDKKETKEEAALREVKEETGINGKIIKPLPAIEYWYTLENEKINPAPLFNLPKWCWIKKTVHYFLMEYVSGDIKDHDFEMENVEWLPMSEVEERLTYKSDKKVWKETQKMIKSI